MNGPDKDQRELDQAFARVTTPRLSPKNIERLRRLVAAGGRRRINNHGRFITLLKLKFVFRGAMPPRNNGGFLLYPQEIVITAAGREFLETLDAESGKRLV